MMKFFHVAIGFEGKSLPAAEVQKAFGSDGWARYAPNCWIVKTDMSAEHLAKKLRKICKPSDSIFVAELVVENNFGYLHKEIWDWLNKSR